MHSRVRQLIPAIGIIGITLLLYGALAVLYPLAAGLFKPRHTWAMQVDVNPWIAVERPNGAMLPIATAFTPGIWPMRVSRASQYAGAFLTVSGLSATGR